MSAEAWSWRTRSCLYPVRYSPLRCIEGEQCQDIGIRNMTLELKVRVNILVILRGGNDFERECR